MNQETTAAATAADNSVGRSNLSLGSDKEYLQELVGSNPESHNWKGIAISLLVILVVCGFVILSVILLTPENNMPAFSNVNLSDVIDEKWKLPKETWIGTNLIYSDIAGNVMKVSSPDVTPDVLISRQTLKDNGIVDYKISPDEKYALLIYNKVPIYKHSYNASYYVYDLKSRTKEPLVHDQSETAFQFAGFGLRENSIVYSFGGDLFYKASAGEKARRLTTGGKIGIYQNGIADWIYEEEILKSSVAHWWSPTGRYLAFASFDDRHVEDSYVTVYTGESASDVVTYQKNIKYKYPKVGYANPVVNIHAINMETMKTITFMKPSWSRQRLNTFHSLTWLGDDEVLITWSNRTLTASVMQQCFPTIATCMDDVLRQLSIKPNGKSGWVTNLDQQILPSDDPGIFFYILPSDHGGMGKYNHLALVNKTEKPTDIQFLTNGNYEVTKLLHYDAEKREVFYVSNERNPGSRHVFRVSLNGEKKCMTCFVEKMAMSPYLSKPLTVNEGKTNEREHLNLGVTNKCQYHHASFGMASDWFMVKCLGPITPYIGIVRINAATSRKAKLPNTLQVIRSPADSLHNMVLPSTRYETISSEDGTKIRMKMLIPASIHVGERPVVFFRGDVGSQTVDLKFKVDLTSYIVKSIGAVAIFIDGRGSSGDGIQLLQSVAGKPGVLEIKDMKSILKYLTPEENIDTENVAVVGDSGYGGYLASLSLTHPEFRCGVARSPISDWALYDSFGSERILGSIAENPLLYQKNNLIQSIEGISGSQLRVFHGIQDRKVNIQHTILLKQAAMLSDSLTDSVDVTYHPSVQQMTKPSEFKKIETNIYESINLFLRDCLFGNSDAGRKKLELLETNYGLST